VIVNEKVIKDAWKDYMEKLMNEENEWDCRISTRVKGGPDPIKLFYFTICLAIRKISFRC